MTTPSAEPGYFLEYEALDVAHTAVAGLWKAFPWKGLPGIRDPMEHIVRPMLDPQTLFSCYEGKIYEWAGRFFMAYRLYCIAELWVLVASVVGDKIVDCPGNVISVRASVEQVRQITPLGYTTDWADSHIANRDILMYRKR